LGDRLILITNDDGVSAPGLLALKQGLERLAQIEIYAPDRNWSAASRTMTFHKPLRVDEVRLLDGTKGHATSGAPSDCVSLALLGLLDRAPDLIVSGINAGMNLGQDVSYSGTVAAAMEGARMGIPAIAVSAETDREGQETIDYSIPAEFMGRLSEFLFAADPLPPGILLNVNIPILPRGRPIEVRFTRLGGRAYQNYLVKGEDPRGRSYYWITGEPSPGFSSAEEGTDTWAVTNGYISISPVHLDMTEYSLLERLRSWGDGWLRDRGKERDGSS